MFHTIKVIIADRDENAAQLLREFLAKKGKSVSMLRVDKSSDLPPGYLSTLQSDFLLITMKRYIPIDIKADILILNRPLNNVTYISDKTDYTLVNKDFFASPNLKTEKDSVTFYGFDSDCAVTASSVLSRNDMLEFNCFLKKSIPSINGEINEVCEFPVKIYNTNASVYSALSSVTGLILCGNCSKNGENLLV